MSVAHGRYFADVIISNLLSCASAHNSLPACRLYFLFYFHFSLLFRDKLQSESLLPVNPFQRRTIRVALPGMHHRRDGVTFHLKVYQRQSHSGAQPQGSYLTAFVEMEDEQPFVQFRSITCCFDHAHQYLRHSVSRQVSAIELIDRMVQHPHIRQRVTYEMLHLPRRIIHRFQPNATLVTIRLISV